MTCPVCNGQRGFTREWTDWHPWSRDKLPWPSFRYHYKYETCPARCWDNADDWYEYRTTRDHMNDVDNERDELWRV